MKWLAAGLVVLGSLQMVGDLAGILALKAIGAATNASPAPKVFSSVQGLETYSTRFFVEWRTATGATARVELTPETVSRLRGPYNRRNVYGAALAYAPVLPPQLREPVMHAALCGDRALLRELGVNPGEVSDPVVVVLEPLPGTSLGNLPTRIRARCE